MILFSLYFLLFCAACVDSAALRRLDSLAGDQLQQLQHGTISSSHRQLKSTKAPSYYVTETSADANAVTVRASRRSRSKKLRSGRVAFGDRVSDGQFPTVVWLGVGDYVCTGTVIASKAVLTAAHCVRDDNGDWIDTADVEVGFGSEYYDYTDAYTVNLMLSPKYDPETSYGDLALLRLTKAIKANFVPLASSSTRLTPQVDVVGRGEMQNGKMPDVMMYTQVSTMSEEECDYNHYQIIGTDPPGGVMCFGLDSNPSTQSCGGDSGGPYFTTGSGQTQVGIVSYGPDIECGSSVDNLEVATSVAYWRIWLDTNLKKYKMR